MSDDPPRRLGSTMRLLLCCAAAVSLGASLLPQLTQRHHTHAAAAPPEPPRPRTTPGLRSPSGVTVISEQHLAWAQPEPAERGNAGSPPYVLRELGFSSPGSDGGTPRRWLVRSESEIRSCMSGRRLLFVGDSILRYTYLAMLRGLHGWEERAAVRASANSWLTQHRSGEPESGMPLDGGGGLSMLWQKEWPSWQGFLNGTTAGFGGKMCCDCHRDPQRPQRGKKETRRFWRGQKENRFYRSGGGGGEISADFFFMHGKFGGHGAGYPHKGCDITSSAAGGRQGHTSGGWRGLVPELAAHLKEQGIAYDAIVFNTGLWYPSFMQDPETVAKILSSLEALTSSGKGGGEGVSPRLLWVGATHPCTGGTHHAEQRMQEFLSRREVPWMHLDALGVTRQLGQALGVPAGVQSGGVPAQPLWGEAMSATREKCSRAYVDQIGHFQPFVYRELSAAILGAVC